ncbi:MAG: dephospho-CoA kinase [Propionibacteriaceae bacterium]|nr:dephospho-CoA kinase [Propionibacteriaceae bacterium]
MRIALTGGIGSGKTAVSGRLERLGAFVIDYDILSRRVVEPGSHTLAEVEAAFTGVIKPDGSLDRAKLGALVFSDAEAREKLDSIIHPAVYREAFEEDSGSTAKVKVHVIPLLTETGMGEHFDKIVVVDAPVEVQIRRVMARDLLTRDQAQARVDAQVSRAERLALADYVIENSGSEVELDAQVQKLWDALVSM